MACHSSRGIRANVDSIWHSLQETCVVPSSKASRYVCLPKRRVDFDITLRCNRQTKLIYQVPALDSMFWFVCYKSFIFGSAVLEGESATDVVLSEGELRDLAGIDGDGGDWAHLKFQFLGLLLVAVGVERDFLRQLRCVAGYVEGKWGRCHIVDCQNARGFTPALLVAVAEKAVEAEFISSMNIIALATLHTASPALLIAWDVVHHITNTSCQD
jgi:hypothetical protein